MAAPNGKCIHCLAVTDRVTADHVFPRSWYPDDTPESVQRPTAPSCGECNNRLSRIEQELLVRLGLCVHPFAQKASGIAAKALRSIGIRAGELSDKEAMIRAKQKEKIMAELMTWEQIGGKPGILPGFGVHPEAPPETQMAVRVSHASLVALAEKIVRGMEYVIRQRYVEPPYRISTFFIEADAAQVIGRTVLSGAQTEHFGPGLRIRRREAVDDPNVVIYEIMIWQTLIVHCVVDRSEEDGMPRVAEERAQ